MTRYSDSSGAPQPSEKLSAVIRRVEKKRAPTTNANTRVNFWESPIMTTFPGISRVSSFCSLQPQSGEVVHVTEIVRIPGREPCFQAGFRAFG